MTMGSKLPDLTVERYRVDLSGRLVGFLDRRGDHVRFSLDREYVRDPERPILGLRIEQATTRELSSAMRLPWWFSNLLPEGPMRTWIAQARHASEVREMELLAQVGHDLPGAATVRRVDEDGVGQQAWPEAHDGPAPRSVLNPNSAWKFSLAGVAMKLSMLRHGDRLTTPATGQLGDWIVKLPDADFRGVPRNEYAMMKLAADAGLDVPEVRLVDRDELPILPDSVWPAGETLAYAIRRFDRTQAGGRVHIEDLAQVRGFYPEQKYYGSFESVAANIFRGRDEDSLQQFVRRLVFIMLIGNGDAHLKNWSLLYMNPRSPRLSPAYDLVSTIHYAELQGRTEDLGLSFGGSRRFDRITLAGYGRLATRLGSSLDLMAVAADAARAVLTSWGERGSELGEFDGRLMRSIDAHMRNVRRQLGV